MLRLSKARIALALTTAALGVSAAAAPAGQAAVVAGNLVGVGVDVNHNNILDQNEVIAQVPVGIAANVCDVSANVLAQQRKAGGSGCVATPQAIATVPGPFQPTQ
jgi:hypothetical protein